IHELSVHKVSVTLPNPCFQQLGVYHKPNNEGFSVDIWNFSFDILAFQEHEMIIFWDFNLDVLGKMRHLLSDQLSILLLDNREVLLIDSCGLSVFKIPTLFQHENGVIPVLPDHEVDIDAPVMDFAHPPPRPYKDIHIPVSSLMPTRYGHRYFYVLARSPGGNIIHDIYAITETLRDDMPRKVPIIRYSYCPGSKELPLSYDNVSNDLQIRSCDRFGTVAWSNGSDEGSVHPGVFISTARIQSIPIAQGGHYTPHGDVRWLWRPDLSLTFLDFSLCPASGRLCIITLEGEVRILDYLAPYN
ncbi:hypothetical protein H0H93_015261, partial [Arthromyces matolae]